MSELPPYMECLHKELVGASRRLHRDGTPEAAEVWSPACAQTRPGGRRAGVRLQGPPAGWARGRVIRALVFGVCVVLAAGALTLTLRSSSRHDDALALPVLVKGPSVDASALGHSLPTLLSRGADLRDAHAIETAYGRGYAMLAENGREVCVALPYKQKPGDRAQRRYRQQCASRALAARAGLVVTVSGLGEQETVELLPADTAHAAVDRDSAITARKGAAITVSKQSDGAVILEAARTGPSGSPVSPHAKPTR